MENGILNYLIHPPKEVKDKSPLLLLIHGYGSNEEDLFSFASELPDDYYVVSVRVSYQVPAYGFGWYAISFDTAINKSTDDQQAIQSRDLLVQFIDELCSKYPTEPNKRKSAPFSQ